jgi:hypothetical protein
LAEIAKAHGGKRQKQGSLSSLGSAHVVPTDTQARVAFMTRADHQVLFTALGFTAVVMQGTAGPEGAIRARKLARLIEEFCRAALPEACAPASGNPDVADEDEALDRRIERFKADLQAKEEARLPEDRAMLLRFYDRLQVRQARRHQKAFYATAPDDLIANRVLTLIDAEINAEGEGA